MSDRDDVAPNPLLDEPTVAPGIASELTAGECSLPVSGTTIDDYTIISEVARGGMGVVYRARHNELDRDIALKMVLESDSGSRELHDRFANEARAAAAIEHPGIVPVYDVGSWNGNPYFTMGFVEGESLHDLLRDGPLTSQRAAEIARDVAHAIASAHQLKIVHRDLKPANILIDQFGNPKVTDFGVSKFLESASDLTTAGELVGTPHYMPPEQAGGNDGVICAASDVYSIGAVLYASLTGRPPFQAASPIDVVGQVIMQQPVAPSALVAGVPVELDVIVLKCLSKRSGDRYDDASELAADLTRYLDGDPIKARPPSLWQRLRLLIQRHIVLASVSGTAALLLLLLTGIITVLYLQVRSEYQSVADDLASTKQMLMIERATMTKYLKTDADSARLESLTNTAIDIEETQPDVAAQLAIAAIEKSIRNQARPPINAIQLLRRRLKAIGSDGAADTNLPLKIPDLLSLARESIAVPLTSDQAVLYGIESSSDSDKENKSNVPLKPKTSNDK